MLRFFKSIQEEYQTFYNYLCTFTHGKIIYEIGKNYIDSFGFHLKRSKKNEA